LQQLSDRQFLIAVGAVRKEKVTRAGSFLLGAADQLSDLLPDCEELCLHHASPTELDQRLYIKAPPLYVMEHRVTE
jgi:hypothetical protein